VTDLTPDPAPVRYAGIVTRTVAFGVDALVVDGIAIILGGVVTLVASVFGHQGQISLVGAVFGAAAWIVWGGVYFVTFWMLTGQTPGGRMLGIRVTGEAGGRLGLMQAVRRVIGLTLALLPLGAGFLPILTDERRRGFHDRFAHTVVRWVDDDDTRRTRRQR